MFHDEVEPMAGGEREEIVVGFHAATRSRTRFSVSASRSPPGRSGRKGACRTLTS